jgi:hypothetical protein
MEPPVLHITEADLVRDVHAILQRVETGAEIIIERDANLWPYCAPLSRHGAKYLNASRCYRTTLRPLSIPTFGADNCARIFPSLSNPVSAFLGGGGRYREFLYAKV